jgi:beta-lactamase class A
VVLIGNVQTICHNRALPVCSNLASSGEVQDVTTRREWLWSALAAVGGVAFSNGLAAAFTRNLDLSLFEKQLADLEEASGGRLGVALLDTASGVQAGHRTDERFPMCSTFKLLAVAAVLATVDQRKEQLERVVRFTQKDIVAYSPATETRVGDAGMSIKELCAAAMTLSDNTAANVLLATIGGPTGLTAFARTLGDDTTRLDRIEPDLNEALPGDPRDTSTPAAMLSDLRALALGNALSPSSRAQLTGWLIQNKTGDKRLRAGLPTGWKLGDKTGSGARGTTNDLAIVWPPKHAPVLVAVYLTGATVNDDQRNLTIAAVGKKIWDAVQR